MRIEAESQHIPYLEELNEFLLQGEYSIEATRIRAKTLQARDLRGYDLHPALLLQFQLTADYGQKVPEGMVSMRHQYWLIGRRDLTDRSPQQVRFFRSLDEPTLELAIVEGSRAVNLKSNNWLVNLADIVPQRSTRKTLYTVVKNVLMKSTPIPTAIDQ